MSITTYKSDYLALKRAIISTSVESLALIMDEVTGLNPNYAFKNGHGG